MSSPNPKSGKKAKRGPSQGEARRGASQGRSRVVPLNAPVIRDAVPVSFRPPAQGVEVDVDNLPLSASMASNRRRGSQITPAGPSQPPLLEDRMLTFYRLASKAPRLKKGDLRKVCQFYHVPEDVHTELPTAKVSYLEPSPFWVVSAEMLRMGLRLPASVFVNNFLKAINRAPQQLMSWGWFCLTAFQVACSRVDVIPTVDLFLFFFIVKFRGSCVAIYPRPEKNFIEGGSVPSDRSRWFDTWFLVGEGGFEDAVPRDFVTTGREPIGVISHDVALEASQILSSFRYRVKKAVFLDEGLLAKAYVSHLPYPEGPAGKFPLEFCSL